MRVDKLVRVSPAARMFYKKVGTRKTHGKQRGEKNASESFPKDFKLPNGMEMNRGNCQIFPFFQAS